jgi:hypothetical protein
MTHDLWSDLDKHIADFDKLVIRIYNAFVNRVIHRMPTGLDLGEQQKVYFELLREFDRDICDEYNGHPLIEELIEQVTYLCERTPVDKMYEPIKAEL